MNEEIKSQLEKLTNTGSEERLATLLSLGWEPGISNNEKELLLEEALKISLKLENQQSQFWASYHLVEVNYFTGNPERARKLAAKCLKLAQKCDENSLLAYAYIALATVGNFDDDAESALKYTKKSMALMKATDDRFGRMLAFFHKASALARSGKKQKALKMAHRVLAMAEELGDQKTYCITSNNIGLIYHSLYNNDKALAYFEETRRLARQINYVQFEAATLQNIGMVYSESFGDFDKARKYVEEALIANKKAGNKRYIARNMLEISVIEIKAGNYEKAMQCCSNCLELVTEKEGGIYVAAVKSRMAACLVETKDYETAIKFIDQALAQKELQKNAQLLSMTYETASRLYEKNGDFEQALHFYKKSVAAKGQLLNEETNKQVARMEAKYKSEKTEREKEIYRLKNVELKKALDDLKETQNQLIQSEKMASLGQLTAGIAHEIKNPLNFVNNFSEVSTELADEIIEDVLKDDSLSDVEKLKETAAIVSDIKANTSKITEHGQRADSIVKNMMLHARSQSGEKQAVNLNQLIEENLQLAYHGYRAKHKDFQVEIKTDFNDDIGKVEVIAQDFGRVIINLVNNAFDALRNVETRFIASPSHKPASLNVTIRTKQNTKQITIRDNGPGIPQDILDKIFNPFFTTKPAGEGTGLGLSLSYDIITKGHEGGLKVNTKPGEFTEFIITLPA